MVFIDYVWHSIIAIFAFAHPMFQTSSFANIWGGGKPVDMGKTWKGKRILGDNKTWKGVIAGLLAGTFFGAAFSFFFADPFNLFYGNVFPCEYPMYIGFFFSIGTHLADFIGSFIKRRISIAPGRGLFPWDQMGYIILGFACSIGFMFPLREFFWYYFLFLLIATFFLHILVSFIAYKLGIKNVWY